MTPSEEVHSYSHSGSCCFPLIPSHFAERQSEWTNQGYESCTSQYHSLLLLQWSAPLASSSVLGSGQLGAWDVAPKRSRTQRDCPLTELSPRCPHPSYTTPSTSDSQSTAARCECLPLPPSAPRPLSALLRSIRNLLQLFSPLSTSSPVLSLLSAPTPLRLPPLPPCRLQAA